jgi:purine-cytosine permease-like protein
MENLTILIIIMIILAAYFIYKGGSSSKQSYSVPSQYKGSEGLDYIRKNYASGLSQAKSLCIGQFKGQWVDSSSEIGCNNMQGFSTSYCSVDVIQNLVKLCNSIGGSPTCSSTEASCSV